MKLLSITIGSIFIVASSGFAQTGSAPATAGGTTSGTSNTATQGAVLPPNSNYGSFNSMGTSHPAIHPTPGYNESNPTADTNMKNSTRTAHKARRDQSTSWPNNQNSALPTASPTPNNLN